MIFLSIIFLAPFSDSGLNNIPFAHATSTYTPNILSYNYAVSNPLNANQSDGATATLNAYGSIVFDLGQSYGTISTIEIRDIYTASTARIDIFISIDGVNYFQIVNDMYRVGGSLTWRYYPISFDKKNIRYVRIENPITSGYPYYDIDDIHLSNLLPFVFSVGNYHYPVSLIQYTSSILDNVGGLCSYHVEDSSIIVPNLYLDTEYIDYSLGIRLNVSSVYLNHSRTSGDGNIQIYGSKDLAAWFRIGGQSGAGDYNFTCTPFEIKYVRIYLNGSGGDNYVYNIGCVGAVIAWDYVSPIAPVYLFDFTFAGMPLLILIIMIVFPSFILYKKTHTSTGAFIGAFIGISVGTYFQVIPYWFILIITIGIIAFFVMFRGREEEG
jgi:hypothetical protein